MAEDEKSSVGEVKEDEKREEGIYIASLPVIAEEMARIRKSLDRLISVLERKFDDDRRISSIGGR